MGRCSICYHAERGAIEEALLARIPVRDIAARWPGLSKTALNRHLHDHLAPTPKYEAVTREQALAERARTESHGAYLIALRSRIARTLDAAEASGDVRAVASIGRTLTGIVELLFKMRVWESQGGGLILEASPDQYTDAQLAAIAAPLINARPD